MKKLIRWEDPLNILLSSSLTSLLYFIPSSLEYPWKAYFLFAFLGSTLMMFHIWYQRYRENL